MSGGERASEYFCDNITSVYAVAEVYVLSGIESEIGEAEGNGIGDGAAGLWVYAGSLGCGQIVPHAFGEGYGINQEAFQAGEIRCPKRKA